MGLSKEQMRDIIENGGTVLHARGLITNLGQLARLHGTDAEKQSEIEGLEKRLAELKGTDQIAADSARGNNSEPEKLDDSKTELMRHTRQELVMKAQAEGIEVGESDTKAEIVQKLLAKSE